VLLNADSPKNAPASFHCQQAAEKDLKAFLAHHGEDPPRTHDLPMLLKRRREHEDSFEVLDEAAPQLYPFAVEVRYPFGVSVSREEAAEALRHVRTVRETVQKKLRV
jgi:HEPN domain-containing protein